MSKSYRLTACFLSLFLAACGGGGDNGIEPKPLNLAGHWIGSGPNTVGGTITLNLVVSESAGAVSGSGSVTATSANPIDGLQLPVLVGGSFVSPSVSLQLTSPPGANPSIEGAIPFAGTLTTSQISGLYAGSIAMTLSRQ